jgi:hypothetical protein
MDLSRGLGDVYKRQISMKADFGKCSMSIKRL